jgi:hypothetical protein
MVAAAVLLVRKDGEEYKQLFQLAYGMNAAALYFDSSEPESGEDNE